MDLLITSEFAWIDNLLHDSRSRDRSRGVKKALRESGQSNRLPALSKLAPSDL